MKAETWLQQSVKLLEASENGTARLDCLVLLEDATGKDRSWLLAHSEYELDSKLIEQLKKQLIKRAAHIPLAFIRGKTEFYGREFIISAAVLEPRPESETMIDLLKELRPAGKIIDVGTGSGALGITAALEIPSCQVELLDIDDRALAIARLNCQKHGLDLGIYRSDLLENVQAADILLANLPYVPDQHELNNAAMNEPKTAIFGGRDGLDLYRRLFSQISETESFKGYVLTESLPFQHESLEHIAVDAGLRLLKSRDLIQVFSTQSEPLPA